MVKLTFEIAVCNVMLSAYEDHDQGRVIFEVDHFRLGHLELPASEGAIRAMAERIVREHLGIHPD